MSLLRVAPPDPAPATSDVAADDFGGATSLRVNEDTDLDQSEERRLLGQTRAGVSAMAVERPLTSISLRALAWILLGCLVTLSVVAVGLRYLAPPGPVPLGLHPTPCQPSEATAFWSPSPLLPPPPPTPLRHCTSMRVLMAEEWESTLQAARAMSDVDRYEPPLLFHAYWTGPLNARTLVSLQSNYVLNLHDRPQRQQILWLQGDWRSTDPALLQQARRIAHLREFDSTAESCGTLFESVPPPDSQEQPKFWSDHVRYMLLLRYGGVWFDLDVMWLRPVDALLVTYGSDILVYRWEYQPFPNGAFFVSLQANSPRLAHIIYHLLRRGRGWGFEEAQLTYDLPLDLLVLPCSWFDAAWMANPSEISVNLFHTSRPLTCRQEGRCTPQNFLPGAFAFHWHNRWNQPWQNGSAFGDLADRFATETERLTAGPDFEHKQDWEQSGI